MNSCPVCATDIEESFGLIECPSCHSVLFVDFDGSLKLQNNDEALEVESQNSLSQEQEPQQEAKPNETFESTEQNNINSTTESAATLPNAETAPAAEDITTWDSEFTKDEQSKQKPQSSSLQEIQDFADSEKSSLSQGVLFYDLILSNVDTQELRDEVSRALQESQFNIDIKKINFKLSKLTIKDLNAVKTSVLVTRLKHLPIGIEWTQTSILQSSEIKK